MVGRMKLEGAGVIEMRWVWKQKTRADFSEAGWRALCERQMDPEPKGFRHNVCFSTDSERPR